MTHYFDTFSTPFGPFSVAIDATGALVGTAFGDDTSLRTRLPEYQVMRDTRRTAVARRQIGEYFAGRRIHFDLTLAPQGTSFQHQVWQALQRIPHGHTTSYGALAKKLNRPGAARAVGRANATNPICLIVPCHCVIGANGSLTGFAFGEEIKRRLLEFEGAI